MDETEFRSYLKKKRRSPNATEQCVRFSREFEDFLQRRDATQNLDNADDGCLQDFLTTTRYRNAALWGIGRYYEFTGNVSKRQAASKLGEAGIAQKRNQKKPLELVKLQGVNQDYIDKLAAIGITNVTMLLEAGCIAEKRQALSSACGIPLDDLLILVQRADLIRIVDIKGLRVNLLCQAGYDSVEKIAACDPVMMQQQSASVNNEEHLLRRAPALVETTYWVRQAKSLPGVCQE